MTRIVPVPKVARSLHAVFTAEPLGPPTDLQAPPAPLLRRFGAETTELERLSTRPHAHVLIVDAGLKSVSDQLATTRRSAIEIAAEHDGIVVDLLIPRVVTPAQTDPQVASHWIALDLDDDDVHSRGLEAFGLPEFRVVSRDGTPAPMMLAVAMGLAQRLISEWPEQDPVGPAAVTLRDIAHAYADPAAETTPVTPAVDLLIDYSVSDASLTVTVESDPAALFS